MYEEINETGKCYGFIVRDEKGELYRLFLNEFENEVSMFTGFLDSTLQLTETITDIGYKYLDFGLIRFCIGKLGEAIDLIVLINSSTTKHQGYKILSELISQYNSQIGDTRDSTNQKLHALTNQFNDVLLSTNNRLEKIHELRIDLMKILNKRKISADIDVDNLDLGVYLKTHDLVSMSQKERKKSLEKFIDSFSSQ